MRLRSLAAILAFMLSLAAADAALACSCVRNPTAESILASATAVFTGVVRDVAPAGPNQSVTTFEVTEAFKGATVGRQIRIRHSNGPSASCGVKFAVGETYTLSAHGPRSALSTSLCSTWFFQPQVPGSADLIGRLRELRAR